MKPTMVETTAVAPSQINAKPRLMTLAPLLEMDFLSVPILVGRPLAVARPPAALAPPLGGGAGAGRGGRVETPGRGLGADGPAYRRLLGRLSVRAGPLFEDVLGPARPPRHPVLAARFGVPA